jgi:hypothetical protein
VVRSCSYCKFTTWWCIFHTPPYENYIMKMKMKWNSFHIYIYEIMKTWNIWWLHMKITYEIMKITYENYIWNMKITYEILYEMKAVSYEIWIWNEFDYMITYMKTWNHEILMITYENYIWKLHMKSWNMKMARFDDYIWKLHMKITYENYIWKLHMKITYEITYENYIWKLHMKSWNHEHGHMENLRNP